MAGKSVQMRVEDTKFEIEAYGNGFCATVGWAQDFNYALNDRPWICKLIFRLVVGKYAWREFKGMVQALAQTGGWVQNIGYSLQDMDYHKDDITLWGLK